MVRCRVIATWRQPRRGSQVRNRLRVPPRVFVVPPSASQALPASRRPQLGGGLVSRPPASADRRAFQHVLHGRHELPPTMHHCFLSQLERVFVSRGGPSREIKLHQSQLCGPSLGPAWRGHDRRAPGCRPRLSGGLHPFIHLSGPVDLVMGLSIVQSFLGIPPLSEHGPLTRPRWPPGGRSRFYLDQDFAAELLPAEPSFPGQPDSVLLAP